MDDQRIDLSGLALEQQWEECLRQEIKLYDEICLYAVKIDSREHVFIQQMKFLWCLASLAIIALFIYYVFAVSIYWILAGLIIVVLIILPSSPENNGRPRYVKNKSHPKPRPQGGGSRQLDNAGQENRLKRPQEDRSPAFDAFKSKEESTIKKNGN